MPRYVYSCIECSGHFQVWHGMKETQKTCQVCFENDCLIKVPQMPFVVKEQQKESKVGALTDDYIEQNKQLLKDMKKEARNQIYED